jgi:hypothetical protein
MGETMLVGLLKAFRAIFAQALEQYCMDKCWGNGVVVIEVDEGLDWGLPRKCIMDKCWGGRAVVIEWTKDSIGICQENVSSFAALAFVYKETLIH